jgi:4a-hydroxytetrahydrobiopterin dehydratase
MYRIQQTISRENGRMTDRMSPRQFLASSGIDDWGLLWGGGYASALYRTGSFVVSLALVRAIGELASAANHHPDIDLRPDLVIVRLASHDVGGLSDRDLRLARQISGAARELGLSADPSAVQHIQVAIDAMVTADVRPFWHAVLGYDEVGDAVLIDPTGRGPSFWFQDMDVPRPQRNRIHIDVYLPRDQAEARIDDALAAGGRMVSDAHAPDWWTLADAEGNEVDLAIWLVE